jgi:hypothetical protein
MAPTRSKHEFTISNQGRTYFIREAVIMTINDFLCNAAFDVNAAVKICAPWDGGRQVIRQIVPGDWIPENAPLLGANITYVTTDPSDGSIVVECDMPMEPLEISKMLTLSTSHVGQDDYGVVQDDGSLPVYDKEKSSICGVCGMYIYIDDIGPDTAIPKSFAPVVELAKINGCTIVCLDGEGPVVPILPVYRWKG